MSIEQAYSDLRFSIAKQIAHKNRRDLRNGDLNQAEAEIDRMKNSELLRQLAFHEDTS